MWSFRQVQPGVPVCTLPGVLGLGTNPLSVVAFHVPCVAGPGDPSGFLCGSLLVRTVRIAGAVVHGQQQEQGQVLGDPKALSQAAGRL